jgi:Phosphoinositide phospholipase C, Ca2+-dependent
LPDPEWLQPGVKVLHIVDLDYETTCVRLVTCLQQVEDWSDANPGHVPIPILLELKQSDPRVVEAGAVVARRGISLRLMPSTPRSARSSPRPTSSRPTTFADRA